MSPPSDVGRDKQMATLNGQVDSLPRPPIMLTVNDTGVGVGGPIGEVLLKDWR